MGNLGCPCLKIFKHNLVRAGADPSHLALVAARSGSGSGPVWSKHKFIESGFVPSRVRFASLASRSGSVGFRLRRETHRACDNFCAPQQTIRRHMYIYIWLCAINPPQPMARKVVRYGWCQDCLLGFMQIRIDTQQRLDLWSNSSIFTYGKKFTELAPKPCFGEASLPHSISLHRWLI